MLPCIWIRPETSGSPSRASFGAFASLDWPWNAWKRITEMGRGASDERFAPQVATAASFNAASTPRSRRTSCPRSPVASRAASDAQVSGDQGSGGGPLFEVARKTATAAPQLA